MRTRQIVLGIAVLACVLVSWVAWATNPEITYVVLEREGYRDVEVQTPLANYILSEEGGVMKSAFLAFAPYGSTVAELVPGTTTHVKTLGRQYVAGAVFPFSLSTDDLREGLYRLDGPWIDADTGEFRIEFQGEWQGATVRKTYTIRPDAVYTLEFSLTIENPATDPLEIGLTVASYVPSTKKDSLELQYLFDGKPGSQLLAKGPSFGGAGLMNTQTVFFLLPDSSGPGVAPFLIRAASGSDRFGFTLSAGSGTTTFKSTLYSGRRRYLPMQSAGLAALDNPGIGARMMIPVIQFLDLLYRVTGNYGWAIILFTVLIRVILFPLMRKQLHSTAKMQRLQPKMKRIQERFKDDKQLLQERLMELYKKEGINPMSGCLPMLIQLPIIWLVWRAILFAGEAIHLSPGFLWVPDLSLADPYFILVIVTTAIMILQQWLMTPQMPSDGSPATKYMGYVFPVFMAILLWKFPAGLWLYYLLTTAVQVVQQAVVNREMAHADRATATESDDGDELGDGGDGRAEAGS